jgi:hypothetical protein
MNREPIHIHSIDNGVFHIIPNCIHKNVTFTYLDNDKNAVYLIDDDVQFGFLERKIGSYGMREGGIVMRLSFYCLCIYENEFRFLEFEQSTADALNNAILKGGKGFIRLSVIHKIWSIRVVEYKPSDSIKDRLSEQYLKIENSYQSVYQTYNKWHTDVIFLNKLASINDYCSNVVTYIITEQRNDNINEILSDG